MQKENDNALLFQKIEQARDLLEEILADVKKGAPKGKKSPSASKAKKENISEDFSVPIRAFVKRHSAGMNGAKKFVLLLAYLAKGDASKQVLSSDIEKNWNKMTGLLGGKFSPVYSLRAKESDWANTVKAGAYHLRPSWKAIF